MDPRDPFDDFQRPTAERYAGDSPRFESPYGALTSGSDDEVEVDTGRTRRTRRSPGTAAEGLASSGPPMSVLYAAVGSVVMALILLAFDGLTVSIVGYVLATLGCISLVCLFRVRDVSIRSSNDNYVSRPEARWLASAVLILGTLAALPHGWAIASEFG